MRNMEGGESIVHPLRESIVTKDVSCLIEESEWAKDAKVRGSSKRRELREGIDWHRLLTFAERDGPRADAMPARCAVCSVHRAREKERGCI